MGCRENARPARTTSASATCGKTPSHKNAKIKRREEGKKQKREERKGRREGERKETRKGGREEVSGHTLSL